MKYNQLTSLGVAKWVNVLSLVRYFNTLEIVRAGLWPGDPGRVTVERAGRDGGRGVTLVTSKTDFKF